MISGDISQEAKQTAKTRAKIYEMLARGFLKEPDLHYSKQARSLSQSMGCLLNEALNYEYGTFDEATLVQEYYDRFFVPSSGKYVPPFESAVIGREVKGDKLYYGSLNNIETLHVLECYRSVGFNPWELDVFKPVKVINLADYIGFELAFMSYLCYAQADVSENDALAIKWQDLQKSFIEEHLINWCFDYADLVGKIAPGFYAVLVNFIAGWIEYDLKTELHGVRGV